MTIIKVKSNLSKPNGCEDCPFFDYQECTEYGETTGECNITCGISGDLEWITTNVNGIEEAAEEIIKNCPIISFENTEES